MDSKLRTDMAEVPLRLRAEPKEVRQLHSTNLVEGLGAARIHLPRLLSRKLSYCGIDVMVVVLEELHKSARVLVVVLEEGHKPRPVQSPCSV